MRAGRHRRLRRSRPDPALEQRLAHGLGRLAQRAVTSPEALGRILESIDGTDLHVGYDHPDRRRRYRRYWTVTVPAAAVTVAGALLAAGAGHLLGAPGHAPAQVVVAGSGAPPQASASAFAPAPAGRPGTTRAAWVSGGNLSILSIQAIGAPTVTVPVSVGQVALNPEWSADGRWLAYLVGERPPGGSADGGPRAAPPFQLRVVAADGTAGRQLMAGPGFAAFSWSPAADVVAAVPTAASGRSEGLVVVTPSGQTRRLLSARTLVNSFVWSPDGRSLAYASRSPKAPRSLPGHLYTVAARGGRPARLRWTAPRGAAAILASWWPDGKGLLAWTDPHGSASLAAGGLPLVAVPLGRGRPHVLATTLAYLPWVDWSPDGRRLAIVEGTGQSPDAGKALALCQPAQGTCRRLAQPARTVSVDPAWSPDGRHLAFVRARSLGSPAASFASRQLWVANADGSAAHAVTGPFAGGPATAGGVVQPAWSADGRSIGYSTGDAVVVAGAASGQAVWMAGGLSGQADGKIGPDIAGKAPWQGVATWDTGSGSAGAAG